MSVSLTREERRSLRRMEERIAALEAGITRHEGRAGELRGILEGLVAEREKRLAAAAAAVETAGETPPATVEVVTEAVAEQSPPAGRSERRGGPPPEAERVSNAEPEPSAGTEVHPSSVTLAVVADRFRRYQAEQRTRRPQVVYPTSSSGVEPAAETGEVMLVPGEQA